MTDNSLKADPYKPTILNNVVCVYCGKHLEKENATKEHVIGRRFVPKGSLEKSWNLILRSCLSCNNIKSDLENDISAISMQPDAWGNHESDDAKLINDSTRKGKKSISRATKKPVNKSNNNIELKFTHGPGIKFNFNLVSPPSIDCERVYELCRLQMMAFYYLLTYQESENRGYYWNGEFIPIMEATRKDWGNNIHTSFMKHVSTWDLRFVVSAADGFFKACIRKQPERLCWSWALEWNQKYRIVGFLGDTNQSKQNISALKQIDKKTMSATDGTISHIWTEIPLKEEEDIMFSI